MESKISTYNLRTRHDHSPIHNYMPAKGSLEQVYQQTAGRGKKIEEGSLVIYELAKGAALVLDCDEKYIGISGEEARDVAAIKATLDDLLARVNLRLEEQSDESSGKKPAELKFKGMVN